MGSNSAPEERVALACAAYAAAAGVTLSVPPTADERVAVAVWLNEQEVHGDLTLGQAAHFAFKLVCQDKRQSWSCSPTAL